MLTFNEHPLRRRVVREMHLRRWPQLCAPTTAVQVLRLLNERERDAESTRIRTTIGPIARITSESPGHIRGYIGDSVRFTWELHSEASALTLFTTPEEGEELSTDTSRIEALLASFTGLDGQVIRATRMFIAPSLTATENVLTSLSFAETDLVTCMVSTRAGQTAQLWSDFRIDSNGFGNLVLCAPDMLPADLSRVAQKIQELGNYRNLALLGLPIAQTCWSALNRIEQDMKGVASDVTAPGTPDELLLDRLTNISLDLMAIATDIEYRMGATAAYAQLVEERIEQLGLQPVRGYPSLADFTQRRLLPAVRTCASAVQRHGSLAAKAGQFSALLRTRVETKIERQNATLLQSMESSLNLQLHLQQMVEGFSIIALSYYATGLAHHVLEAVRLPGIDTTHAIAALVPAIILAVTIFLRRLRKHVMVQHQAP
jgi:uncharacterized membrane-anchored protein